MNPTGLKLFALSAQAQSHLACRHNLIHIVTLEVGEDQHARHRNNMEQHINQSVLMQQIESCRLMTHLRGLSAPDPGSDRKGRA